MIKRVIANYWPIVSLLFLALICSLPIFTWTAKELGSYNENLALAFYTFLALASGGVFAAANAIVTHIDKRETHLAEYAGWLFILRNRVTKNISENLDAHNFGGHTVWDADLESIGIGEWKSRAEKVKFHACEIQHEELKYFSLLPKPVILLYNNYCSDIIRYNSLASNVIIEVLEQHKKGQKVLVDVLALGQCTFDLQNKGNELLKALSDYHRTIVIKLSSRL